MLKAAQILSCGILPCIVTPSHRDRTLANLSPTQTQAIGQQKGSLQAQRSIGASSGLRNPKSLKVMFTGRSARWAPRAEVATTDAWVPHLHFPSTDQGRFGSFAL